MGGSAPRSPQSRPSLELTWTLTRTPLWSLRRGSQGGAGTGMGGEKSAFTVGIIMNGPFFQKRKQRLERSRDLPKVTKPASRNLNHPQHPIFVTTHICAMKRGGSDLNLLTRGDSQGAMWQQEGLLARSPDAGLLAISSQKSQCSFVDGFLGTSSPPPTGWGHEMPLDFCCP